MKKQILFICLIFLNIFSTNAQMIYKSGGTSNSTYLFGYANVCGKSQCIYLPSDLTNTQSGSINRLYYKYGSTGNTSNQILTNFEISLGQTTATGFSGTTFFTGLTQVFSAAAFTIPPGTTGTWFHIDLNSTFVYDATQTLIIQLKFSACAIDNYGTYGTTNTPVKKIFSGDLNATVAGTATSTTWQDMGFDLVLVSVPAVKPDIAKINVFPNPCNGHLSVNSFQTKPGERTEITFVNCLGEIVMKKKFITGENNIYDVSGLPKGIYFLKAKFDDAEAVRKILVE